MTDGHNQGGRRLIWDLPTRIFHWGLAISFAGAYLLSEADDLRTFHVMFGYTVLGLVAFRLLWGVVGSTHSRFSNFAYGPGAALRDLRGLLVGRARDHEGHGPAASWSVYLLLALAAATAMTGWLHYNRIGGESLEEVHEALANAWLVLVVLHVGGVLLSSWRHRRNLVRPMIYGYREGIATGSTNARLATGLALVCAIVGFWSWTAISGMSADGGAASIQVSQRHAHDHDDDDD